MAHPSPDPNAYDVFLQRRVARVLMAFVGLLGMFLVYSLLESELSTDPVPDDAWSDWAHVAATGVLALITAYAASGRRTVRQLYAVEAVGVLSLGVMLALMSTLVHVGYRPEFSMLSGLTLIMLTRSAFVPSTARRTAILCMLLTVPLSALTWQTYVGYEVPAPGYPPMSPGGVTVFILLWWVAASATAVATSQVIYGLRREVDRVKQLGQYALVDKIGEGGMGSVYRASHAMLRRPTAIKLLVNATDEQARRFEREVQLTASLTHPNTIAIFDYGRTPDGVFYYAMEYLEGWDLEELVEVHGPLGAGRVIHLLTQVCAALAEAHDRGLIHRDIKPANIISCERGGVADVAKVLDFGLVKSVDTGDASAAQTSRDVILGTPLYMAPEAIKDPEAVDARSDLYALGAVAYFLLCGQPPFEGDSVVEICGHHLHSAPVPPSSRREAVAADLEALVLRCLAKAPGDRPDDARALAAALSSCADAGGWTAEDATAWWGEHGARKASAAPRGASATVAIDLAARG